MFKNDVSKLQEIRRELVSWGCVAVLGRWNMMRVYGVALSPRWCNVVMCGAGGCGFGFAGIMAFMCQRSLIN